jgi:integrase
MALTDAAIKKAKPAAKPYKMSDGAGMYLYVTPAGGKYWKLKYRAGGKERKLDLGEYPAVKLKAARQRRDDARDKIAQGIDPQEEPAPEPEPEPETFRAVAMEWLERQTQMVENTRRVTERRWQKWVFPHIGDTAIGELEPPAILHALRGIEAAGKHETAHRMRQRISQVMRYAIATGRASRDPAADLKGALSPVPKRNRAAITEPGAFGGLLRAIDAFEGEPTTIAALRLLALTFVRPGELRHAHWSEFDLTEGTWRIPASRMKMDREHIVPLAPQAVAILRELEPLTARRRIVFEGLRPGRPLSENTLNTALRTMGYGPDTITAHGFRATASTLLHERGWPPEVIELQLAHAQRSEVAAAYNRSARLEERRRMMAAWADYLDALKDGEAHKVVPLHGAR